MGKSWLKTRIYKLPDNPTEEDLRKCLPLLPDWRKQQVESFRFLSDRLQCAKAYILLKSLIEEVQGKHVPHPSFEYGQYGKPTLSNFPYLHFNMSHCHKAVICVLSNVPVGCDIEEIPNELDSDILASCFSLEEQKQIRSADNPQVEFTRQWTRKESLLKLLGIGLTDNLPLLLSLPLAQNAQFDTVSYESSGYVYSTCYIQQTFQYQPKQSIA